MEKRKGNFEHMEYNDEILKKLHDCELMILDDFISVCEENHLTWWAFGGTGIGALRHQGFIPWDDDIDVCVMREDMDQLVRAFQQRFPDKYQVLNTDLFPSYPVPLTQITLKNSVFVEESLQYVKDVPLGIFLDVYAFDHVARDPAAAKRQAWKTWFWGKMMILTAVPFPMLAYRGIKKKLIHAATATVWAVLRLLRVSPRSFYARLKKAATRYNQEPADAYAYFNDTSPFTNTYTKEDLFPLQALPFEGRQVLFPHELDKTLRVLYGDYMQLPPPEKRKNHFPVRLKFPDEDQVYTR